MRDKYVGGWGFFQHVYLVPRNEKWTDKKSIKVLFIGLVKK